MTKQELKQKLSGYYDDNTKETWKEFIKRGWYNIDDIHQFFCENNINLHLNNVWEDGEQFTIAKTWISIQGITQGYFEFDNEAYFNLNSWEEFENDLLQLINQAETINKNLSILDKCQNIC